MKRIYLPLLLCLYWAGLSIADPFLVVFDEGTDSQSLRHWNIGVVPDSAAFSDGKGALAIEFGLEVHSGQLVSVTYNDTEWPYVTPGNNPFTGGVTLGVVSDVTNGTVFASLGSDEVVADDFISVLTLATSNAPNLSLSWGGQTLLPGSDHEYVGGRISQGGINYDSYQGERLAGSATCDFDGRDGCNTMDLDLLSSEIANHSNGLLFDIDNVEGVNTQDLDTWLAAAAAYNSPPLVSYPYGDANLDGNVDAVDLTVLAQNLFRSDVRWSRGDFNSDGQIDGRDLNIWNKNKFTSSHISTAVPEPSQTRLLIALFSVFLSIQCRRRCTHASEKPKRANATKTFLLASNA